MRGDRVELGVELLSVFEDGELTLADALDRIEAISSDPNIQRQILERADVRGIIDRDGERVIPRSHAYLKYDADVIKKEGSFTCRRCGSELTTGYFMNLDAGELGPFGSSCIRKVTGRE